PSIADDRHDRFAGGRADRHGHPAILAFASGSDRYPVRTDRIGRRGGLRHLPSRVAVALSANSTDRPHAGSDAMKGFVVEDTVVRTSGLCKTYGTGSVSAPVLCGIDLKVSSGECVYLVGPSGSGKTTLLSILGCVLSADAGSLEILGADALRFSNKER